VPKGGGIRNAAAGTQPPERSRSCGLYYAVYFIVPLIKPIHTVCTHGGGGADRPGRGGWAWPPPAALSPPHPDIPPRPFSPSSFVLHAPWRNEGRGADEMADRHLIPHRNPRGGSSRGVAECRCCTCGSAGGLLRCGGRKRRSSVLLGRPEYALPGWEETESRRAADTATEASWRPHASGQRQDPQITAPPSERRRRGWPGARHFARWKQISH
jgi:hypothetical protein